MTPQEARLRAALEAGPTPGPWTMTWDSEFAVVAFHEMNVVDEMIVGSSHHPQNCTDAAYIAAASPDVVAVLLRDLDDLRAAATDLIRCYDEFEEFSLRDRVDAFRAALAAHDAPSAAGGSGE